MAGTQPRHLGLIATLRSCAAPAVCSWGMLAPFGWAAPPHAGVPAPLRSPEEHVLAHRILDLRLPAASISPAGPPVAVRAVSPGRALTSMPAPPATADADFSPALRGLEAAIGHSRSVSRAELLARQFHHDGLPLLRPWENHSAFLSLGLSPRGKPGLWLVQKTH